MKRTNTMISRRKGENIKRGNMFWVGVCLGVVGAVLVAGMAGTANAAVTTPATGGLPLCQANLNTCDANLGTCTADLAACEATSSAFPASGQTTAFTADKNDGILGVVAVPDDGTVQAGATLSYTDNGDGTITDNNTGLMWDKKTNLDFTTNFADLHDADNYYVWSGNGLQETIWEWLEDVNAEGGTGFAGHNDWRIPNVKELVSIVNYGLFDPSIDATFGPTQSSLYWSSTTRLGFSTNAWLMHFIDGDVNGFFKTDGIYVRAVRGGN